MIDQSTAISGDAMAEQAKPWPNVEHWQETVKALGAGDAVDQQQVKRRAKANILQAHVDIERLLAAIDDMRMNGGKRINKHYDDCHARAVDEIREREDRD